MPLIARKPMSLYEALAIVLGMANRDAANSDTLDKEFEFVIGKPNSESQERDVQREALEVVSTFWKCQSLFVKTGE